jgi:uncharacterized protein
VRGDDSLILRWPAALAAAALARPHRALAWLAAVTLAAAPGLLRLELRMDGHSLVPPSDPAVRFDAEVREHFGLRDVLLAVVVSDHPDGVLRPDSLRPLVELARGIERIEGIGRRHVQSLVTATRERRTHNRDETFSTFLDPFPDDPETLGWLREDLDRPSAQVLGGTLIAHDRRAAAVVVGVPEGNRQAVVEQVAAVTRNVPFPPSERVLVVGAPVAEVWLGHHVLEDLARLLPLCFGGLAAVIWLACRRLWGVALALGEVGGCLVFTFGVMGWLGVPVYLTTAMLPVILTATGLTDELHFFFSFQQELAATHDRVAALRGALARLMRPMVLTALTTALGFLSFLGSQVPAVRWFGVFAAVGVLYCLVWSRVVTPAVLMLLPERWLGRPAPPRSGSGRWRVRGAAVLSERRRWVLLAIGLVSGIALLGASRLEVQDSWIGGFAPGSPFRRASEEVDARLAGTHVLLAHLALDPAPGQTLLEPVRVAALGRLEAEIASLPGVGGALGLPAYLRSMAYFWRFDDPRTGRVLPEDERDLVRLVRRLELSLGLGRRREIVDDELRRTVVMIFLKDADYRDTARIMTAVRGAADRLTAPLEMRFDFAGDLAVSQAMIPAIVRTQVGSLVLALLGAWLVSAWLHRSVAVGLLTLLPASLASLWVFGGMGWLGVPLGVATSMCCAITLGIGVDFAIHFLERWRSAAGTARERVAATIAATGPAIVADTAAVSFGFGVLVLSEVPANAALGLLVSLALVASCGLTLVGLGAALGQRSKTRKLGGIG